MKNLVLLMILMFASHEAFSVCNTPISRTNNGANTVLTSTKINADFNAAYTRINELPGDCITAESITTTQIDDGTIVNADISTSAAITRSKLGAVNYSLSAADSGAFSSTSSTYVDVTNLTASITTTGNPVEMTLVEVTGSDFSGYVGSETDDTSWQPSHVAFVRASTVISAQVIGLSKSIAGTFSTSTPCSSFRHIDFPAAGAYTYKVQVKAVQSVSVVECKLLVREL